MEVTSWGASEANSGSGPASVQQEGAPEGYNRHIISPLYKDIRQITSYSVYVLLRKSGLPLE